MQHRSPRALPWAECGNWAYSPPHLCSQRSEIMHLYEPFTKNGKALKILIWQSELPNWRMRLRIRSLKRTTKLIWQFRLPICKAKMKSVCCNWRFVRLAARRIFVFCTDAVSASLFPRFVYAFSSLSVELACFSSFAVSRPAKIQNSFPLARVTHFFPRKTLQLYTNLLNCLFSI